MKQVNTKSRAKGVRGIGAHLARVSMDNHRLIEESAQLRERVKLLEQRIAQLEQENMALRQRSPN